ERLAPGGDLLVQPAEHLAERGRVLLARPDRERRAGLELERVGDRLAVAARVHARERGDAGGGRDGEERDRVVESVRAQRLVAVRLQVPALQLDGLARRDLAG